MIIAAAQYPITFHKTINDWKKHVASWVEEAQKNNAKILVFPEYGSMEIVSFFKPEIQENLHLQIQEMQAYLADFIQWYQTLATKHEVVIVTPSFPVKVGEQFHNRTYVIDPKKLVGYQDKLFMTRFENEIWHIQTGEKKVTLFDCGKVKFGIQTCYDSEFAIGTQYLGQNEANLLLVPSCTETLKGATRVHVGSRSRAMEQQIYTCVAQTIGEAPWSPAVDINYGFAAFYSTPDINLPDNGIIQIGEPQVPTWVYADLNFDLIEIVQKEGQVFNFQDHQNQQMLIDGKPLEVEILKVNI